MVCFAFVCLKLFCFIGFSSYHIDFLWYLCIHDKNKTRMKNIINRHSFQWFAEWFRYPIVIIPIVAAQFTGMELFLLYLPGHSFLVDRLALYTTLISSICILYASVACRSYIRSGGDSYYQEKAKKNLVAACICYFVVLLSLTVLAL